MKNEIQVKNDRNMPRRRDEFSDFDRLAQSFFGDRFPSFLGSWATPLRQHSAPTVREEDDAFILAANLPGIPKEDIHVQVSGNILTIHAEHSAERGEMDSDEGYRQEYSTYHQSFTLPANVEAEEVEARCEDGRLEILLPKNAQNQQRRIEVQSGKGGFSQRRLDQDKRQQPEKTKKNEKH